MAEVGPVLTLRDVAEVAGVQRAVVSTWRNRPRVNGQDLPFPQPVSSSEPIERFRRDEIVDWLERTGRGNSRNPRLDAVAMSVPDGVSLDDLVTLLCLRAQSDVGIADLSADEWDELATRADSDDQFFLSEIRQASSNSDALRFIDDLVNVSFGLPDALARLENGPAGRALRQRELTADAVTLLAGIVRSAGLYLDPEGVPIALIGIPPGPGRLLADACRAPALVLAEGGPADRALHRWATITGLEVATSQEDTLIRVLSVLGLSAEDALNQIDRLVLDLAPRHVGVVIGASGALCDALRGAPERIRSDALRVRHLVAALRLPRGMWRHAPRQALGVWVCAGGRDIDHPRIADLSADAAAEISTEDLAADVSGALPGARGRAYRYLRAVELATILAGAPLVPPGVRAPRLPEAYSGHLDHAQAAAMVLESPLPKLNILVAAASGSVLPRRQSLAELQEKHALAVLAGCGVGPEHAVPGGSVRVLNADGVLDGLALDPLDVGRIFPRASRTEPNDVIFLDGARPHAWVDVDGGALVASPSRILRLRPTSGLGSHTLAAIINGGTRPGEWRTWDVPVLPVGVSADLEAALADAAAYNSDLRRHQTALNDLITALIEGVASGTVAVVPPLKRQEGRP